MWTVKDSERQRGLLAAWCPALDHHTGGIVRNLVSQKYHGAMTNFVVANAWGLDDLPSGVYGTLECDDATSTYANCGHIKELDAASKLTVVTQWRRDVNATNRIWGQSSGDNNDFNLAPWNTSLYLEVGNGANTYNWWTGFGTTHALGTWIHCVVTFDGTNATPANRIQFYTSGVNRTTSSAGTVPTTLSTSTADFWVGGDSFNGGYLDGALAEVRLYVGYVFTAEEAAFDYANPFHSYRRVRKSRVRTSTVSSAITLTPNAATIPIIAPSSTLAFGGKTLTPNAAPTPLVAPSPTIVLPYSLTPSPAPSSIVSPNPTLAFGGISLTPSATPTTLAVPNAAIALGDYTLSPDVIASVIAVPNPSLAFGDLGLAVDAASVVLSVPAPLLALAQTVTPDAATITLVVPSVTLQGLGGFDYIITFRRRRR